MGSKGRCTTEKPARGPAGAAVCWGSGKGVLHTWAHQSLVSRTGDAIRDVSRLPRAGPEEACGTEGCGTEGCCGCSLWPVLGFPPRRAAREVHALHGPEPFPGENAGKASRALLCSSKVFIESGRETVSWQVSQDWCEVRGSQLSDNLKFNSFSPRTYHRSSNHSKFCTV